jgi:nitroimidazol reductase NimA-like FMN-containing flavoprotein (pyridoxamine 5'-phosphate oxidase superfamily)
LPVYKRANRQYVAMSRKEVWEFLQSQRRVYLGFSMDDGYPHVTPIWFVTIGEKVYMRAQSYKVKVGLAKKGKACVVIDDGDRYRELKGAVMWGRSRLLSDKRLISKVGALFEEKYADRQWKAAEMPGAWVRARSKETRSFIEFVPEKVDSWDNSKV